VEFCFFSSSFTKTFKKHLYLIILVYAYGYPIPL